MASPECQEFHQQSQAIARRHLGVRLSQGTKATTPQVLARRWAKHDFKGLPANSTGSRSAPFFENAPQNYKPLDEQRRLTGGVLRNYSYAKYLLKKRRDNVVAQQLAKENVIVPASAPPSLTPADSRNLELNIMLQELSNAITGGQVNSAYMSSAGLLKILNLLSSYMIDGMNEEELTQFRRFFDELAQEAESLQGQETIDNPKVINTIKWIDNINKLLTGFAKDINETRSIKQSRLAKLMSDIFKIKLKKRPMIAEEPTPQDALDAERDRQPGSESGYSAQTGTTATGHREADEVEARRRDLAELPAEVNVIDRLNEAKSRAEVFRIMREDNIESYPRDSLELLWNAINEGKSTRKLPADNAGLVTRIFNKLSYEGYSPKATKDIFLGWLYEVGV